MLAYYNGVQMSHQSIHKIRRQKLATAHKIFLGWSSFLFLSMVIRSLVRFGRDRGRSRSVSARPRRRPAKKWFPDECSATHDRRHRCRCLARSHATPRRTRALRASAPPPPSFHPAYQLPRSLPPPSHCSLQRR